MDPSGSKNGSWDEKFDVRVKGTNTVIKKEIVEERNVDQGSKHGYLVVIQLNIGKRKNYNTEQEHDPTETGSQLQKLYNRYSYIYLDFQQTCVRATLRPFLKVKKEKKAEQTDIQSSKQSPLC